MKTGINLMTKTACLVYYDVPEMKAAPCSLSCHTKSVFQFTCIYHDAKYTDLIRLKY